MSLKQKKTFSYEVIVQRFFLLNGMIIIILHAILFFRLSNKSNCIIRLHVGVPINCPISIWILHSVQFII